jgi:hypothetical protein
MTRVRDIATMLGRTEATNTDNSALSTGSGGTVSAYTLLDSLPVSDLSAGNQAFVSENNRLYVSNGSGWYNVSLINAAPYWDSAPLDQYTIVDSATPLIITAKALDSDNPNTILSNLSFATDSAQYLVDVSADSSVFTFTPKSQDSVGASVTAGDLTDSNLNDFIYTFKWSDGINFVSKAVTINYNFGGGIADLDAAEISTLGWTSPIRNDGNKYTYNSGNYTWTKTGYTNSFEVLNIEIDMTDYATNDEWNIRFAGGGFGTSFNDRSYHIISGVNSTLDANPYASPQSNYFTQNRSDQGTWEVGSAITNKVTIGGYSSLNTQVNYVKATGTWTYYMSTNGGTSWTQGYSHNAFGAGNSIDKLVVTILKREGTGLSIAPATPAIIP